MEQKEIPSYKDILEKRKINEDPNRKKYVTIKYAGHQFQPRDEDMIASDDRYREERDARQSAIQKELDENVRKEARRNNLLFSSSDAEDDEDDISSLDKTAVSVFPEEPLDLHPEADSIEKTLQKTTKEDNKMEDKDVNGTYNEHPMDLTNRDKKTQEDSLQTTNASNLPSEDGTLFNSQPINSDSTRINTDSDNMIP